MSIIGGKKREHKQSEGFSRYIGFFKAEVVAVNPDREKVNELLGKEDSETDKEIEYTGEKDGVEFARVTFWLKVEGKKDLYIPHTITLKNEVRRNKAGDKIQVINQTGDTTWIEADEDNDYNASTFFDNFKQFTNVTLWVLPNGDESEKWVKGAKPHPDHIEILGKKKHRPALIGEEELAELMKVWLSELDFKHPETNLLLDTKKLFADNFKDLQLVGGDFDRVFTALAYVKADDNDPEKLYQRVFKKFLPPVFMKYIANGCKMPNNYAQDVWDRYVAELEGDYGPDGKYVEEPLKEYDPNEDVAASKKTKNDEAVKNPTSSKY